MFHIGELGGVLKTLLWEKGVDYISIPPTAMKSVIAQNGAAKKPDISSALKTRFGLDIRQNDEADATGLLLIGEMLLGIRAVVGSVERFASVKNAKLTKGKLILISKPQ